MYIVEVELYEASSLQHLRFSQWLAEDSGLPGCDAVLVGEKVQTLWRILGSVRNCLASRGQSHLRMLQPSFPVTGTGLWLRFMRY